MIFTSGPEREKTEVPDPLAVEDLIKAKLNNTRKLARLITVYRIFLYCVISLANFRLLLRSYFGVPLLVARCLSVLLMAMVYLEGFSYFRDNRVKSVLELSGSLDLNFETFCDRGKTRVVYARFIPHIA